METSIRRKLSDARRRALERIVGGGCSALTAMQLFQDRRDLRQLLAPEPFGLDVKARQNTRCDPAVRFFDARVLAVFAEEMSFYALGGGNDEPIFSDSCGLILWIFHA